ncbi:MAG: AgmX/PglI C-terminal domain-containing protein [Polyangiaceae bacterium]
MNARFVLRGLTVFCLGAALLANAGCRRERKKRVEATQAPAPPRSLTLRVIVPEGLLPPKEPIVVIVGEQRVEVPLRNGVGEVRVDGLPPTPLDTRVEGSFLYERVTIAGSMPRADIKVIPTATDLAINGGLAFHVLFTKDGYDLRRIDRSTVTSQRTLARTELESALGDAWKKGGLHQKPADAELDRLVLRVPPDTPIEEILAALTTARKVTRKVVKPADDKFAGGEVDTPAMLTVVTTELYPERRDSEAEVQKANALTGAPSREPLRTALAACLPLSLETAVLDAGPAIPSRNTEWSACKDATISSLFLRFGEFQAGAGPSARASALASFRLSRAFDPKSALSAQASAPVADLFKIATTPLKAGEFGASVEWWYERTPIALVDSTEKPDPIEAVMVTRENAMLGCYALGVETNPGLSGKLGLTVMVGYDGRVGNVDVTGDFSDGNVSRCIADAVGRTVFPAPAAGLVRFKTSLEFAPSTPRGKTARKR